MSFFSSSSSSTKKTTKPNIPTNFKSYLDSPTMPRLLNCMKYNLTKLGKKTKRKIFVSTMFKDEEGFLAEFVAYYKRAFNRL